MATNPPPAGVPDGEIGWAFQVKADYIPNDGERARNVLQVARGDLGYAFRSTTQPAGWILCKMGLGERKIVGWVNKNWMNTGLQYADPLPVETTRPLAAIPPPSLPANASCLERTVHGLWNAIRSNRTTILTELPLPAEVSHRLFGPNTSHYPNEIMQALTPTTRQLMASGNFHPDAFLQMPSIRTNVPTRPGIYIRIYPGIRSPDFYIFRGHQKPNTGLYTGQTIGPQWAFRSDRHDKDMDESDAQHYRLARTCDTDHVEMIPIILFDENRPMVVQLTLAACLSAAELTMVCLFKSWHPLLLGPTPLNAVAAYILDFRSAKVFANIMDEVRSRTGWQPREIVGCNWQTPLVRDMEMETVWTSYQDFENEMMVFRCRRNLFLRLKKNGTPEDANIHMAPNEKLHLPMEVLKQANFRNGQPINVVVEFMDNNVDHPSMWVRFPRIGPNRELEILRSMAIRLEWLNPSGQGQWFTCALTRSQVWTYMNNDATKIPAIYQNAMTIVRMLRRFDYHGAPGWFASIGRVVIKKLTYEHLHQRLTISNAQSQNKQWPQDNTIQHNTQRILALVNNQNWPTSVGVRPNQMPQGRKACDLCVSQASTTPCFGGQCNFDPQTRTCSACSSLRRPCTFTRDTSIVEKLQTGGIYSELGMATNIYYMSNQAVILPIEPPFDTELSADQNEDN